MNVTAKDKATAKEQPIRIQAKGGLSDADIDKMVKDAEAHAAEDKARSELVEARNQAGERAFDRKSLTEFGDKISAADKEPIEAAIAALKTALEGEDPAHPGQDQALLAQASMKLGEANTRPAGRGARRAGAHDAQGKDDVIDADFKEVGGDDHKKSRTPRTPPRRIFSEEGFVSQFI